MASSAVADTATLTAGDASTSPALGQQVLFNIPLARGAVQTYDTAVGYHVIDNGAIAGADYVALPGTVLVPHGTTSVNIPVTVKPGLRDGGPLTFQFQIDNATRIGPVPLFGLHADFSAAASSVPYGIASADLNGDGMPDIVTTNGVAAGGVSVLLSTTPIGSAPAFAAAVAFATGPTPQGVAISDIDGDGKPDLVVANYGSNNVSILLNTTATGAAAPTFATQQTFVTGLGNPHAVAIADVNGDGKPDLIVTNQNGNQVSVLLNTTSQSPTALSFTLWQPFTTGINPQGVAIADLNGDGLADIVVANHDDNTLSVLLNTTAPGASIPGFAAQQTFVAGSMPSNVRCADLNGDGRPDLIVSYASGSNVSALLNVTQHGDVSPRFAAHKEFGVGLLPFFVAVADLNLDGKPDLISADYLDNTVSVLLNTTAPGAAAPSFAARQTFNTGIGSSPQGIAVGDIDINGWPDLIVADSGNGKVSVLRNTTAPDTSAPMAFGPLQPFPLAVSGAYHVVAADINGDGRIDLIGNGAENISVVLNTTAPGAVVSSFSAPVTFAVGGAGSLATYMTSADLNGDGKPDLISITTDFTVSVLINTTSPGATTPSFAAQQTFPAGIAWTVTSADVNGDGKQDLIVGASSPNQSIVLVNTTPTGSSTIGFAPAVPLGAGNGAAAADFNGDGKPDVAIAGNTSAAVFFNTTPPGAGASYSAGQGIPNDNYATNIAVADFNRDGKPDITTLTYGGDQAVSVLLNSTTPGALVPSFPAFQSFATIGKYGIFVAASDIDGDGRVDLISGFLDLPSSINMNATAAGATTANFAASQAQGVSGGTIAVDVNGDGKSDLVSHHPFGNFEVQLNSQLFVPFTATAATASITPDRIFASGNEVLPVQCSGTSTYADYLIEDFPGSALDASRWTAHANGGSVTVANNALKLASGARQFPFVTSAGSPLPATGNFSVRWNATYDKVTGRGDGALVVSRGLPANSVGEDVALRRANVWQDSASGFVVADRSNAASYGNVYSTAASSSATHDVEYCWLSSSIEIWVDGALVTQQSRDPALERPDALWMGNPVDVGSSGNWNDFTLHSVHVRSVSP